MAEQFSVRRSRRRYNICISSEQWNQTICLVQPSFLHPSWKPVYEEGKTQSIGRVKDRTCFHDAFRLYRHLHQLLLKVEIILSWLLTLVNSSKAWLSMAPFNVFARSMWMSSNSWNVNNETRKYLFLNIQVSNYFTKYFTMMPSGNLGIYNKSQTVLDLPLIHKEKLHCDILPLFCWKT